jgi:hypothetical protein
MRRRYNGSCGSGSGGGSRGCAAETGVGGRGARVSDYWGDEVIEASGAALHGERRAGVGLELGLVCILRVHVG